jgi:arylsulfatase
MPEAGEQGSGSAGRATSTLLQALACGGLAGLFLGLYLGAKALVNQPATGISVLRFYTRDIFQLLYLPALACLGLGAGTGLVLWLPATLAGRKQGRVGLVLLVLLLTAGAVLAPWWSSLLPAGMHPGQLLRLPPVVFDLLTAMACAFALGGAAAALAAALHRRGLLGRAGIILAAGWSAGTLLALGLALTPVLGGGWLIAPAAAAAAALLFVLLTFPPALRGGPGRPWATAVCIVLVAVHLAAGLFAAATLPEVTRAEAYPAPDGGTDQRPNILLVSVDTLRSDRLSCYGSERTSSPALDRFSREAVLFQRMTSNSPWTLPAMSALFTGRLPSALGMGGGPARLPASVPTLATSLAREGYLTRAIATNPWLKRDFGFDRGFSAFTHLEEGGVSGYQLKRMFWHRLLCGGPGSEEAKDRIRADQVTGRALDWLDGVPASGQPFFLWLHYMDPHEPYSPPAPPAAGPYRGRFLRSSGLVSTIMQGGLLDTADLDRLQLLYDEEILSFDRQLGRLVSFLRVRGLLQRTMVLITADHGEEFLEHGGLGHGHTLYDELLHVPLLVRLPGGSPGLVSRETVLQSIDLYPTVLALAGVERTPPGVQGREMAGLFAGLPQSLLKRPGAADSPAILSEGTQDAVNWKSLEVGDFKLILDRSSGTARLFRTDPLAGGEVGQDADPRAAQIVSELRHRIIELDRESRDLAEAAAVAGPLAGGELSPEMNQQLRALGYLR